MHVYYKRYPNLLKTIFGQFEDKQKCSKRKSKQNGVIILRLLPQILFVIVLVSTIYSRVMYLYFLLYPYLSYFLFPQRYNIKCRLSSS